MINDHTFDAANIYTNFQGLHDLKKSSQQNQTGSKTEVARQFESLLMQMVVKSMRDATNAFKSDEDNSQQHCAIYEDMFDKQMALSLATKDSSLTKLIEKYLEQADTKNPAEPKSIEQHTSIQTPSITTTKDPISTFFDSAPQFVKTLWSGAKVAAKALGADPKLLLAQAALETAWGKKIIQHNDGNSTHNLFNIKADSQWKNESAALEAIEQKDGLLTKEKSNFRSYKDFTESFKDYVNFLKNNPRYQEALKVAHNSQDFIQQLQKANFATDSEYANKVMSIFNSKNFNQLFNFLK